MGTKALVRFYTVYGRKKYRHVTVYYQWDGYLNGVGLHLAKFSKSKPFVNGIRKGDENVFNGFDCFIAQYISTFKTGAGGLYIIPRIQYNSYDYEFVYDVFMKNNQLYFRVNHGPKMSLEKFLEYCS